MFTYAFCCWQGRKRSMVAQEVLRGCTRNATWVTRKFQSEKRFKRSRHTRQPTVHVTNNWDLQMLLNVSLLSFCAGKMLWVFYVIVIHHKNPKPSQAHPERRKQVWTEQTAGGPTKQNFKAAEENKLSERVKLFSCMDSFPVLRAFVGLGNAFGAIYASLTAGSVAEEPNLKQQRLCPPHLHIASRFLQHTFLQAPRLKFADRRDSNAKNPVQKKFSLDFTFPPKPSRAIVTSSSKLGKTVGNLLQIAFSLFPVMDWNKAGFFEEVHQLPGWLFLRSEYRKGAG